MEAITYRTTSYFKKVNLIQKIFVWSLMIEPLNFFIVGDRYLLGIDIRVGRLLQLMVIILLVLNTLVKRNNFVISNPFNKENKLFSIFIFSAILSYCYGVTSGAFELNNQHEYTSNFLSSPSVRPIFEFIILIFWFSYYVVLPRYLLNTIESTRYLFKIFSILFFACIWLGLLDYVINILGSDLIPRHISDWGYVPKRFHGLAGEPRDAIVYLGFGIAMLVIRDIFFQEKYFSNIKLLLIILCIVLTQSLSGMIGILLGLGLVGIYFIFVKSSIKRIILFFILVILFIGFLYTAYLYSPRIQIYFLILSDLYSALSGLEKIPGYAGVALDGQMQNIYPLWQRWLEAQNSDFTNIIFGTGFGSASVITNNLDSFQSAEMLNPHSQLIRLFVENGIIGTIIFISAFLYPISLHKFQSIDKRNITLATLFLVGLFLGHRSSTLFIFSGIFICLANLYTSNISNKES
jgi:hypothetical protein